ncbi:UNVERIFIED_CONTAM: Chloroplast envelope membrane protein [Sesamum calycinum]|uniref:Chloroplast envelope membrane protein n=1 Tax=Sesamum calycinum TaxID=2727403 RepID=A0AAW2NW50_9LAMI
MFFMSTSMLCCGRRKSLGLIPNAKKRHSKRRSWWQRFFFDEEGNWLGLKDEDMLDALESEANSSDDELSENEKFEAWKRRAETIVELREAQEDVKNEESRRWRTGLWMKLLMMLVMVHRGLKTRTAPLGNREMIEEDDILYEDRVFRYASFNSAKFLAVLIIVPWAVDFLVHDYVLMPFLDRYVKTVPLAAKMLDIRKNQKLQIVKALNLEKARYRLEVEIGKSPPLSDDELYLELRHRALEMRDEWRLENRKAFANIWSDVVFGISLFLLLYFYQGQVALLKFTGYKIVNNITDTGKAFLIILITDIFLGYHSESGWQTLLEIIVEHYGLEVDQSAITIFICLIPVVMDACVKLWLFKFLPRLSPKVSNIFQEMKRH